MTKRKQEFPLYADQGMQFGQPFYQALIEFGQMENFFRVFGEVQRNEDKRHAKQISMYVMDILNNGSVGIIPTITVNARGPLRYDEDERKLWLSYETVLSINDGQHRYRAIQMAIDYFKGQIARLESLSPNGSRRGRKLSVEKIDELTEMYKEKLRELQSMSVSLFITDNVSEQQEQQNFTDINKSQKKVNKSKALKYDHRDPYARLTHEIVDAWDIPLHLEVESDRDKLGDHDPEFTLFNTLVQMTKHFAGTDKNKKDITNRVVADEVRDKMVTLFHHLTRSLPKDIANREKYILANSIVFQAIAKQARVWDTTPGINFEETVAQLAQIDWTHYAWMNDGLLWDPERNRVAFKGSSYIRVIQEGIAKRITPILDVAVDGMVVTSTNEVACTKEESLV